MKNNTMVMQLIKAHRNPAFLLSSLFGVLLFILGTFIASAELSAAEEEVFWFFNDLDESWHGVVAFISFLGSPFIIPLVAIATAAQRKYLNALKVLLVGFTVLGFAALLKLLEIRTRPEELLDNVIVRESVNSSLGYPSGHTAVAVTLALLAYLYLPRKLHKAAIILAIVVALSRLYLGVHLPMDLVGGWGLALFVVGIFNVLLGTPERERSVFDGVWGRLIGR